MIIFRKPQGGLVSLSPAQIDAGMSEGMVRLTDTETQQVMQQPATVDAGEMRRVKYADTLNGSDRLFIEYQALLAKGSDGAEAAKDAWLARREEIKQEYPLNGQS